MTKFQTEPIPQLWTSARRSRWAELIAAAREASMKGQCVVLELSAGDLNSLRASGYHSRRLRRGEKVHIKGDTLTGGTVRIWMTFDGGSDA